MKKISIFIAMLMAMPILASNMAAPCDDWVDGYPSYFCDCEAQVKKNKITSLPFDVTITDTIWYKFNSSLFLEGFTAYLYSDCNVTMTIMQNCFNTSSAKLYREYEVSSNQARDVDANDIKEMMEEQGATGSLVLRLRIAPSQVGVPSRFIFTPYNEGPHSTCDDCFALLPDMVFVSSHTDDVYSLDPQQLPEDATVSIEWFQTDYYCDLEVTRGTCDGDLEDYYPYDANDSYTVSPELLNAARTAGEKLYFHFYHPAGTVGRIRLNVKDNTPTDLNQVLTPAPAAKLRLTTNGELYILRGTERYTITGQRY